MFLEVVIVLDCCLVETVGTLMSWPFTMSQHYIVVKNKFISYPISPSLYLYFKIQFIGPNLKFWNVLKFIHIQLLFWSNLTITRTYCKNIFKRSEQTWTQQSLNWTEHGSNIYCCLTGLKTHPFQSFSVSNTYHWLTDGYGWTRQSIWQNTVGHKHLNEKIKMRTEQSSDRPVRAHEIIILYMWRVICECLFCKFFFCRNPSIIGIDIRPIWCFAHLQKQTKRVLN